MPEPGQGIASVDAGRLPSSVGALGIDPAEDRIEPLQPAEPCVLQIIESSPAGAYSRPEAGRCYQRTAAGSGKSRLACGFPIAESTILPGMGKTLSFCWSWSLLWEFPASCIY